MARVLSEKYEKLTINGILVVWLGLFFLFLLFVCVVFLK